MTPFQITRCSFAASRGVSFPFVSHVLIMLSVRGVASKRKSQVSECLSGSCPLQGVRLALRASTHRRRLLAPFCVTGGAARAGPGASFSLGFRSSRARAGRGSRAASRRLRASRLPCRLPGEGGRATPRPAQLRAGPAMSAPRPRARASSTQSPPRRRTSSGAPRRSAARRRPPAPRRAAGGRLPRASLPPPPRRLQPPGPSPLSAAAPCPPWRWAPWR